MASAKDLKKKIKSISNTRKITRTMEMVAASKSKKTTNRLVTTTPYSEKLTEFLESLCGGEKIEHPLLGDRLPAETKTPPPEEEADRSEEEQEVERSRNAFLVVTANRGLCGGYNTNTLNQAEKWIAAEHEEGRETDVSMIGKKGIARFRFKKIPVAEQYTHISDWPSFSDAEELAKGFMERYERREVDRVMVLSSRYRSASVQKTTLSQLLPIVPPRRDEDESGSWTPPVDFIFEPDADTILQSLLPFSVSYTLFRLLVEAAACEQIARRIAMKLATDNADDLVKIYTRQYNRQRQAGITRQIMEIVGGAQAQE